MKLIFNETKFNKYSITSLIAALEHKGLLNSIDIEFFSWNLPSIDQKRELIIFCYSFCTPQFFDIRESIKKLRDYYPHTIFVA